MFVDCQVIDCFYVRRLYMYVCVNHCAPSRDVHGPGRAAMSTGWAGLKMTNLTISEHIGKSYCLSELNYIAMFVLQALHTHSLHYDYAVGTYFNFNFNALFQLV